MKVKDVLPYFGNRKTALAEALGVSKQAVSKWGNDDIPALHEMVIRYELLPKVFGKKIKAA
jgi:DNA-binding XRE family transcriptional regulator